MPPKPTKKLLKCFVPNCENVEGCGKIFLHTPRNPETFKAWCDAVGAFSGGKCCEDHFQLSEDAENWQYFKLCGNGLKIKKGVVPHRYLDSKCPDTGSQFSDEDKKIKLEFLNSMVTQRKIVTRVNRIEDLKAAAGPTETEKLEELAKNNARTKRNATQLEYRVPTESAPSTLEVTPEDCEYILGPTTDITELVDRPQIPITTSASGRTSRKSKTGGKVKKRPPNKKSPRKKPKVEIEYESLPSSESELSIFDGDYSEEDPDYDPDPESEPEDLNFEEPALAELREDDLMKTVLKTIPVATKREPDKEKPVKSKAPKSRRLAKKAHNQKLEKQEVKSRPKRKKK